MHTKFAWALSFFLLGTFFYGFGYLLRDILGQPVSTASTSVALGVVLCSFAAVISSGLSFFKDGSGTAKIGSAVILILVILFVAQSVLVSLYS